MTTITEIQIGGYSVPTELEDIRAQNDEFADERNIKLERDSDTDEDGEEFWSITMSVENWSKDERGVWGDSYDEDFFRIVDSTEIGVEKRFSLCVNFVAAVDTHSS